MTGPKARQGPKGPKMAYRHFALQGWRLNPDRVALIDVFSGERITFRELDHKVHQFAAALQSLGVSSQSRVQFFAGNSLESLIAREASLFCNATTFLFKPNKTVKYDEYKFQVEDSEVEFIITDMENYDIVVHQLLGDSDCKVRHVILLDGTPTTRPDDRRVLCAKSDLLLDSVFVEPEIRLMQDILVVSYTSGSTGRPKGVMHSNYSLTNALFTMGPRACAYYLEQDRFLMLSSLSYVSGMMFTCGPLAYGATVIMGSHAIDPALTSFIERYQATIMFVPEMTMRTATSNPVALPEREKMLVSLRVVLVSGTRFPDYLRKKTTEFFYGKPFQYVYGSTEAIGMIVGTNPEIEVPPFVGFVAPNVDLRLVDDNGKPVPAGVPGEVQWKAPQLTLGYWKRPSDEFLPDGFFATGDIGLVDSVGRLSIIDRKKNFMVCLDERVSPGEIEDVLFLHPAVLEVVVVGVPDQAVQEAPTALIVLKDTYQPSEILSKEMLSLVESKLCNEKQLYGGIHFVKTLEMTESGKYARASIAKRALHLAQVRVQHK